MVDVVKNATCALFVQENEIHPLAFLGGEGQVQKKIGFSRENESTRKSPSMDLSTWPVPGSGAVQHAGW